MKDRLIFETETERAEMRKLLSETFFPHGKIWFVPEAADYYVMDVDFPCSDETFFRYAIQAPGPHGRLAFSCMNLTLMTLDPPPWMAAELSRLQRQRLLPAKTE
jgi:hypothetical protein